MGIKVVDLKPSRNQTITNDNQTITKQKPNNNQEITKAEPNDNVNVNVNVNDNVNVKNKRRFTPPTEEEVRAYCEERGNCVDPQTFINFYDSKGWMIGKNRMKDWKAAVRTWERSGRSDQTRQEVTAKRDRFNNFPSRSYDMDNLERQLLGWKAAVRTWERSGRSDQTRQEVTAKRDRFNNFPSRSYDMDNLERQLLGE